MIHKHLSELSIDSKTNLTFCLVNSIPFSKPDIMFHLNHNPAEIAACLNSHHSPLLLDLNSISEDVTVNIDRIYKFNISNSNLVGRPFPETNSIRIRINLKTFGPNRPPVSAFM